MLVVDGQTEPSLVEERAMWTAARRTTDEPSSRSQPARRRRAAVGSLHHGADGVEREQLGAGAVERTPDVDDHVEHDAADRCSRRGHRAARYQDVRRFLVASARGLR